MENNSEQAINCDQTQLECSKNIYSDNNEVEEPGVVNDK
jgi:hypothetical protein